MEVWKLVKHWDSLCEISNYGNARTIEREIVRSKVGGFILKGKPMKKTKQTKGYLYVKIVVNGAVYKEYVHRLVAKYFINNTDNKPCVNHINGDKTDNRVENLEWVTNQENTSHAISSGLFNQNGERNRMAKLSIQKVRDMREQFTKNKISQNDLSIKYGVGKGWVSKVLRNKIWIE